MIQAETNILIPRTAPTRGDGPPNQVIPAQAVEAAARMLAETCDPLGDWDKKEESYRGIYRRRVMPCLQAAAPHMTRAHDNKGEKDAVQGH